MFTRLLVEQVVEFNGVPLVSQKMSRNEREIILSSLHELTSTKFDHSNITSTLWEVFQDITAMKANPLAEVTWILMFIIIWLYQEHIAILLPFIAAYRNSAPHHAKSCSLDYLASCAKMKPHEISNSKLWALLAASLVVAGTYVDSLKRLNVCRNFRSSKWRFCLLTANADNHCQRFSHLKFNHQHVGRKLANEFKNLIVNRSHSNFAALTIQ